MTRDYHNKGSKKWITAIITEKLGNNICRCQLKTGEQWKRHSNQLTKRAVEENASNSTDTKQQVNTERALSVSGQPTNKISKAIYGKTVIEHKNVNIEHNMITENVQNNTNVTPVHCINSTL